MNYKETLEYMFNKLPMFQRIGGAAYKADLGNTIRLCEILHHPEHRFPAVHIAGTNGKGSTSHMLASVFQEAGFKTGLYTSPHYSDFRERIKIDGKMVPEQFVVDFMERYNGRFEDIGLSFFEMTVGMAFSYFADGNVDIAVIETGMGGRLDSTNVIMPMISVITNIGMDHMQFLGNSLAEIAAEKAGIIKPSVPVVIGETQESITHVFHDRAEQLSSPITFADRYWKLEESVQGSIRIFREGKHFTDIDPFPLNGSFQRKNLVTVMETLYRLQEKLPEINPRIISAGIAKTVLHTGLKGRWQILQTSPLVVCDSGHNPEGIAEVISNIHSTPHDKLHIVFGIVNDKDASAILSMLPANATYYFCKPYIPRGLEAEKLAAMAAPHGLKGSVYNHVKEALKAAIGNSEKNDLIFVGGSTFVVAGVV